MTEVARPDGYSKTSTHEVASRDAFAYWTDLISSTFVRLEAEPKGSQGFRASLEHVRCGGIDLATVSADSQIVRRTSSLIKRDSEEYVIASILFEGHFRVQQDGRTAMLSPGEMTFYDTTRPFELQSDEPSTQLVIKVPASQLRLGDTRALTANALGARSPAAVVSPFFTAMRNEAKSGSTAATDLLVPHALRMLSAVASFAAAVEPPPESATALARQQVSDFLFRNLANPSLDAHDVAAAFNVSTRTLYRIVGKEGIAGQLRRFRMERAKQLLRVGNTSIGAVAAACGFDSESGFHRAFREATGQTPGSFRQRQAVE